MGKLTKKGLELKLAYKKEMKEKRKNLKEILKSNRAKLIVRNLPFKANEANLKELFQQYGDIESVNILKKPDGKLVGCAFVQFKLVQKAAKARHHLNGNTFLDRAIEVDFAKAKNKYKKEKQVSNVEVKSEDENSVDLSIVKTEPDDTQIKEEVNDGDIVDSENKEDNDSENDESLSETSSVSEIPVNEDIDEKTEIKKPHIISNDVSEGKTVFIKNVPFTVTNEDLKECMLQFGHVYYALVCVDCLTEHSKGTAFVKFVNKEDADKCLQAGTELTLQGNILDCHPALHKQDLQQKEKEGKTKQKDSRNLYLVKEGVILANTKAAEGVSASDMTKRLQLEQYKTQMLRNLNMYIAKTRLIIHNLPPSWNDSKLQSLFKKHSNPNAVIREARIMRDMRNVDSKGIGASKEYGFVSFTTHEDALTALRALNNNPTIFTAGKRPIVAFSIENRAILKAKEKRLQKSKMRNPNSKDYNPEYQKEEKPNDKKKQASNMMKTSTVNRDGNMNQYSGVAATPGIKKMRSKFNLRSQAKLHFENLKNEKKKRKSTKALDERRKDFRKQPRQKINNKKQAVDNFSVLVNKYKQTLKSVPLKTSKWYE
ncbi:rna-binding motif protein 14b [Holotrichia oblita]|uniref:Rna-binding motif protein 14b n=1 Tax=Holotrichia oblita TaxID=644536 RepID=A0ACB9TAN0_HOLOL|nr:rna-binding motif protein 14b [Holotrichia oblita]